MKTFGWDTVFLVREDRLNTLLEANADKVILDFAASLPNQPSSMARGRFSPWQIAQGGSNEIIHLRLPIQDGTLEVNGQSYNLAGLTLVVATYLDWLALNTDKEQLVFDYNKLGEPGDPPNRGELSVIQLQDQNEVLPVEYNALLSFALGQYLVQHVDQVRFVFATVNLIAPTSNSWLAPRKSAYAYVRREDSGIGFLAILSVTNDRDISNLQRTVDSTALPTETNTAYVISNELLLLNVVAPGLAKAFNTDINAFYYDASAQMLRNSRSLGTKGIKVAAITYYPEINVLEVGSGENALKGHYEGKADMKAGIYLYFTIDSRNGTQYLADQGALSFIKDPSPSESHHADIPWWFFLAGPIVIGITEIVVSIISSSLAEEITNDNRERLALGKHPPASILLGDSSLINVTYMGINEALYLYGNV